MANNKKMIGEGTYGKVFLVRASSGEPSVLKECDMAGLPQTEVEATLNEVRVLKRLQHPNIVAYKQAYIRADTLCIEMEWAAGALPAFQSALPIASLRPFHASVRGRPGPSDQRAASVQAAD